MKKVPFLVGFVGHPMPQGNAWLAGFSPALTPMVCRHWDDLVRLEADDFPEVVVVLPGAGPGGAASPRVPTLFWTDQDLLQPPADLERRILEARSSPTESPLSLLLGDSPAMARLRGLLVRSAHSALPLTLLGENGTGKDLAATVVHRLSGRRQGPLVAINCGAVPTSLAESEFFGCVRGAFTGAENRTGYCQQARGGTLFLDEIGELVPEIQTKLLRVLESQQLRRVGATHSEDTDFRLVCATNKDLAAEVKAGRFREDLYYRINVLAFSVPPLRDRKEDIGLLANHFLRTEAHGVPGPIWVGRRAVAKLQDYHWPGNLRQLRNVVLRAAVLFGGPELQPEHLEWKED